MTFTYFMTDSIERCDYRKYNIVINRPIYSLYYSIMKNNIEQYKAIHVNITFTQQMSCQQINTKFNVYITFLICILPVDAIYDIIIMVRSK